MLRVWIRYVQGYASSATDSLDKNHTGCRLRWANLIGNWHTVSFPRVADLQGSDQINFCLLMIPGRLSSYNVVKKKLQKDWNNVADYPEDDAGWNPAKIWWDLLWSDMSLNYSLDSFPSFWAQVIKLFSLIPTVRIPDPARVVLMV